MLSIAEAETCHLTQSHMANASVMFDLSLDAVYCFVLIRFIIFDERESVATFHEITSSSELTPGNIFTASYHT